MVRTGFIPRLMVRLASLLLCSVVLLGWSLPGLAAPGNNKAKLEEQVLEIIRQHPEALIESVRAYEQKQQEQFQKAQLAFLQQMKANPQGFVGQSPAIGPTDAKIVLLEFSDFQCPYCAEARKTLKQFAEAHPDQVRFAYKHFPIMPTHSEALPAARAAWAAGQQGKFWQYHDALFTQRDKLGDPLYLSIAKSLKLDIDQFEQDRSSELADLAIDEDMNLAQRLGINGTPFVIMNGEIVTGSLSIAALENVFNQVQAEVAGNFTPNSSGNQPSQQAVTGNSQQSQQAGKQQQQAGNQQQQPSPSGKA